MRSRLRLALFAAVVMLALGAGPSARAANPQLLRTIVTQIAQGRFNPCDYTPTQLQTALSSIPPDFDQYAPQVRAALENAANSYHCPKPKGEGTGSSNAGGGGAGGSGPRAAGGTPSAGTAAPPAATARPARPRLHEKAEAAPAAPTRTSPSPAPVATKSVAVVPGGTSEAGGTPAILLVLAVLGGLGALSALLVAASRGLGWEPGWAPAMRHAWAEAGHRSGGTWGDFRDWLRLGR